MAAMFSNVRPSNSNTGNILEFKAGRSNLEPGSTENTRKVVADPKKGLVYIKQSNDMLTHFCWKDRESGAIIDDLIIFPDDAEFKVVNGCPDGKVYMLKFKSSKDMRLYWLQDGSADADKDLVKKVNDALNKPASSRPSGRGAGGSGSAADRLTAGGFPANLADDFGGPLGGLDQSQLLTLIQSLQGGGNGESLSLPTPKLLSNALSNEADCEPTAGGAATASTGASGAPPPGENLPLTATDLSKILNNLQPGSLAGSSANDNISINLSDALSNEAVAETAKANAQKLIPHLPETKNTPERELNETVRAPQFRQATNSFGHALQTGQLAPVLSQFGLNEETINSAARGDLVGFAKNLTLAEGGAVPKEEDADESTKEPEAKRNRPDLDDMDVD